MILDSFRLSLADCTLNYQPKKSWWRKFKSLYLLDCSGGNRQLTLREADCVAGRIYTIKKTDGGAVNLLKAVPEADGTPRLIDGTTVAQTAVAYGVIRVVSDGTNWFTI